jgi:uncharacterized integral membrane protein
MTEPRATESTSTGAAPTADAPQADMVPAEARRDRLSRHGRRARLYTWAILLAVMLIVLVALIVANTRQVKVSWVVGDSHASLVWLVIIPALLGWVAGIATSVLFRRRTRAPR